MDINVKTEYCTIMISFCAQFDFNKKYDDDNSDSESDYNAQCEDTLMDEPFFEDEHCESIDNEEFDEDMVCF